MKKIRYFIAAVFLTGLLTGCNFIGNIFKYRDISKEFTEALIHENYDKCISLMDLQGVNAQYIDTLKKSFKYVHESLVENFGDKLDYTFETAEKTFSTNSAVSTIGQTVVNIQIANARQFGVVRIIFNDKSQKIFNFNLLDVKEPIPNLLYFWLFGIAVLGVLAFNIYMIVLVKRSKVKRKWLKYLAIILLNVPAVGYKAVGGLFFSLTSIQLLFGISFAYTGYLNSVWIFGIPVGSLFILIMLKRGLYQTTDDEPATPAGA